MDAILGEAAQLTPTLLAQNEDNYNTIATNVVSKLRGAIPPSAATKNTLDVSIRIKFFHRHADSPVDPASNRRHDTLLLRRCGGH
jgi:hypothetical protein